MSAQISEAVLEVSVLFKVIETLMMGDYCNFSFNTFWSTHYTTLSIMATNYFKLPFKILSVVLRDTPRS